jgi:hypothetical protein
MVALSSLAAVFAASMIALVIVSPSLFGAVVERSLPGITQQSSKALETARPREEALSSAAAVADSRALGLGLVGDVQAGAEGVDPVFLGHSGPAWLLTYLGWPGLLTSLFLLLAVVRRSFVVPAAEPWLHPAFVGVAAMLMLYSLTASGVVGQPWVAALFALALALRFGVPPKPAPAEAAPAAAGAPARLAPAPVRLSSNGARAAERNVRRRRPLRRVAPAPVATTVAEPQQPVASFSSTADCAVIIPVHGGWPLTAQCLSSLRRHAPEQFRVIVVDDGSTDGTAAELQKQPDVLVVRGDGELWWSGAVDLGCREAIARGVKSLVLLNNDNVDMSAKLVGDLVETQARIGGCVSAVGLDRWDGASGRVLIAGGSVNWRGRGLSRIATGETYVPEDLVTACDWLPGFAICFDSDLFEALDGFDRRRFPQYRGDADFTMRARATGAPCTVNHSAWILNDTRQGGLSFDQPVGPASFVTGFGSLRSNYHVPSTIRFALRHCPAPLVPWYLVQFYCRYAWASLKSNLRRRPRP